MELITVIEVDQWTSTGIKDQEFDRLTLDDIHGGDADAVKRIFGGWLVVKQVAQTDHPRIGHVWFIKGADGKPLLWRCHYDSSD